MMAFFFVFPITGGGERGGAGDQMAGQGVLMPPREPDGPGEMGKAVVLPKELTAEQKKLVDDGWQKNAFNQYVSDMISVHRTLPDPRDDRHVVLLFLLSPIRRFEIGGGDLAEGMLAREERAKEDIVLTSKADGPWEISESGPRLKTSFNLSRECFRRGQVNSS